MKTDFLDMEKEAKELATSLKKLSDEVKGYKSSKEQLTEINKTLAGFIDETKKLTEKSAKIIQVTSEFSPTKIEIKIDELEKKLSNFEQDISNLRKSNERFENSVSSHLNLLTKAVDANSEAIRNKKFSLLNFGGN